MGCLKTCPRKAAGMAPERRVGPSNWGSWAGTLGVTVSFAAFVSKRGERIERSERIRGILDKYRSNNVLCKKAGGERNGGFCSFCGEAGERIAFPSPQRNPQL